MTYYKLYMLCIKWLFKVWICLKQVLHFYIYISTFTNLYLHFYIYKSTFTFLQLQIYNYKSTFTFLQLQIYIYISAVTNLHLHIYIYISTFSFFHLFNPVRIRVRIGSPHPLVCRKRRLIGDPWGSGLEYIKGDCMGRSFGWDRKNRGPVSQQVWHDKDPSLLKGPERRA